MRDGIPSGPQQPHTRPSSVPERTGSTAGKARSSRRRVVTPYGYARVHINRPPEPTGPTLILGHGAGGTTWTSDALDLVHLTDHGWVVVLVDQPWRVAGRTVATNAASLDVAWKLVVPTLTEGRGRLPGPYIAGGRSAGARVACRTAHDLGMDGVLAVSFPLNSQSGADRGHELDQPARAGIPSLVLQGDHDAFGTPDQVRERLGDTGPGAWDVQAMPGSHSLAEDAPVHSAVLTWWNNLHDNT